MINCVECGKSFAPVNINQKFCSEACRDRFKKRKLRLKRKEQGLCPQCGGPMDYPVRVGGPGSKSPDRQKITYCSKCREKFREWKKQG
ncbi:MAG: hypothetical protein ACPLRH_01510 [Desulfotomaculales bacterium]